jgi:hypothetical protein
MVERTRVRSLHRRYYEYHGGPGAGERTPHNEEISRTGALQDGSKDGSQYPSIVHTCT